MSRRVSVFVVSLPGSAARRAEIEAQFRGLGIDFAFYDAVKGTALSHEELARYYDQDRAHETCQRQLTRGEIGCSLSHLFLYKKMAEENIEQAIILEDDAILNPNFAELYKLLNAQPLTELQDGILILGGQEGLLDREWWLTTSLFGVKKLSERVRIKKSTASIKYIARTCAYALSLKVAKKIYAASLPVHIPIDHWRYLYKRQCFSAMYVVDPWAVRHPVVLDSQSLIEQERAKSVDLARSSSLKVHFRKLSPLAFNFLKNLKHLARQVLRLIP